MTLKKKCKIYMPTNNLWMIAIRNLVKQGELTVEQANECYRRINGTKNN